MTFLPDGEKEMVTKNYLNPNEADENGVTFRVLSSVVVGQEYWKTVIDEEGKSGRKPIRVKATESVPMSELEMNKWGNLDMPRYFWSFCIWNVEAKKVQIMNITQKSIRRQIKSLLRNKKWGDPHTYDLTLTKTGEGRDTEYTVMPNPKEKLDPGIIQMYKDMKIDMDVWFKGKDPFKPEEEKLSDKELEDLPFKGDK